MITGWWEGLASYYSQDSMAAVLARRPLHRREPVERAQTWQPISAMHPSISRRTIDSQDQEETRSCCRRWLLPPAAVLVLSNLLVVLVVAVQVATLQLEPETEHDAVSNSKLE